MERVLISINFAVKNVRLNIIPYIVLYAKKFLLPKYNLIIEIDGTYWHNYPEGLTIDYIRTEELSNIGLNVLRIWDKEIIDLEQNLFILKAILDFIEVQN